MLALVNGASPRRPVMAGDQAPQPAVDNDRDRHRCRDVHVLEVLQVHRRHAAQLREAEIQRLPGQRGVQVIEQLTLQLVGAGLEQAVRVRHLGLDRQRARLGLEARADALDDALEENIGTEQDSSPYQPLAMSAGPDLQNGMPTHLDMHTLSQNGLHNTQQMVGGAAIGGYQ